MLHYLRYRYVKMQMSAYINGELDARMRRIVARMIDQDPRCYAEYQRYLRMHSELQREIPLIGKPAPDTLGAIWENIALELATPSAPRDVPTASRTHFGMLAIVMIALAILPMMIETGSRVDPVIPTHPLPEIVASSTATAQSAASTAVTQVALLVHTDVVSTRDVATVGLQNTPAPQTPNH
jgi:anti-sigma factor RsiW